MRQTMHNSERFRYVRPELIPLIQDGTILTQAPQQPTRLAYGESILEVASTNPDVVVLNADVAKPLGTMAFRAKYPAREFSFGIAEQNMMAAAAGMATTGLIPFVTTYAVFASLRALDQVRNSICYPRLNVKIAASHSGITPGPDGVTHQGQEDLSIMRTLPNMAVVSAADSPSTKLAVAAAARWVGPVYLGFTRDPVPMLFDEHYPFEIGQAVVVRVGEDATIVANRDMVVQALLAAEMLSREGLEVRVLDCHTVKPLDEKAILTAARETGAIVTAENNVIYGGLGSAVAELLVENELVPMQRIGVRDTFAESGPYLALLDKYGLSARHIAEAVWGVVRRKQGG
jgi:transketolase